MENNHEHHDSSSDKLQEHAGHPHQPEMVHNEHNNHTAVGSPETHAVYMNHEEHNEHSNHQMEESHEEHAGHVDHSGHEGMFRQRFWVSLALSIPVLLYSPSVQGWLNFKMPEFPGSGWITPIIGVVIFFYGGLPFLQMAVPEIKNRKPGMITRISLAIGVAFIYSLGAFFFSIG